MVLGLARGNQVVGLSTKRRPEASVAWTSPAPTEVRTFEMVASGMRLNAVESASAAVAVGITAVTLRYRAAQPPECGSNRWLKRPFGVEAEAIGARGRDRLVSNVQGLPGPLRRVRVGDPDPPRPAVRTVPQRPALAHIDEAVLDALGAQDLDDAVRRVALVDAVKGEADPARRRTILFPSRRRGGTPPCRAPPSERPADGPAGSCPCFEKWSRYSAHSACTVGSKAPPVSSQ